ncbi:Serine/threonine protein kinase [Phytophthora megakarya]|uniref:Serine/threonine protein kinase n=1 Tax=Phytophthora megakarya TaxID=4795 RepID=A0A225W1P3_9STRA|nr:Serine/threonine protein kinase [Phytophthora megakarya]
MGEFRLAHIRGKLPVKSTLTDIRARCNRIPELAAFGLHIIDRLELLQDEVAKLNENDPSRVSYADVIQHLVILTRRKPLLVRLAKGDTVALMFKELHVMLDSVKSGLHRNVAKVAKDSAYSHLSNTYRDLTKWQKKWECNQVEHISLLTKLMENVTGRQLVMELKDDKMVEKVLRKLRQTIDKGVCGAMLELVKVSFDRVASYCKLSDIQFVDWFISEDDLLFDNVPATIGTFGTVRRARWFHGGVCTRVMVKQVYPDTSNNTEDEFFCQLDRWNNLLDEHILKFYGGSHISTPRMFVCDCGPCNFRDFFIDWGNMKLFWPMFLQVAQGLKALHAQGIVHGSLKCSNIIVTDDKTVKLMDFGFDSVRTKAIVPTSVVATALAAEVRWKPKEMLEESDLSEQRFESDIYSLGMCMIEAIEKKVPFHYATDMEATDKIMRGERHRRPSTVHDSSWSLIEVLCDPDNSKRPSLDEVIERIHYLTQVHEEIETEVVHSEECNGRKVVKL